MQILLLNQNHIGDALFTTPAIAALRTAFPDAHIVNAAVSSVMPLFTENPHVSKNWTRPATKWHDFLRFLFHVRGGRFDTVISFSASSTLFGIYAQTSGARTRIGFDHRAMRRFVTHPVTLNDVEQHHVLDHLDQVAALAPIRRDFPIELHLKPGWHEQARHVLTSLHLPVERPLIGLNPGATMERKMWAPDRWAALADALTSLGCQPLLFGGPGDAGLVARISAGSRFPVPSTQGTLSLGALAAAAKQCSVFVSGDTGPMHIAVAVNTPVVALHGPTLPARTGPFTRNAIVIHHHEKGPDPEVHGRMETITVDEVAEAVRSMVSAPAA